MAGNIFRSTEKINVHLVYGVLFTLIAVAGFIAFVLSRSLTDTSTQTASIGNAAPTFTGNRVYLGSASDTTNWNTQVGPLTLTENTATNVYVHGTINDDNGCTDVNLTNGNWIGTIFRDNATNAEACTADNNACYTLTESDMTASSSCTTGTSMNFQFTKAIQYYADATDASAPTYSARNWDAYIAVGDGNATATATDTQTFEIATVNAVNVGSSIAYGSVNLGATSSEQTLEVTNTGNNTIDLMLSGTGFTCDELGTINATQAHYSVTTGQAWSAGTSLTGTAATLSTFSLAKTTSATAATKALFWLLQTPSSGVRGTCSSTVTVTATGNE